MDLQTVESFMISKNLQSWIDKHYLDVVKLTNNVLQIKDTELFFFIISEKEKLFDEELFLLLSDDEFLDVDECKEEYKNLNFLFEFGEAFYYCPLKLQKDSFNEQRFKITTVSDFLYLGHSNTDNPSIGCLGIHSEYEILNVACNYNTTLKKAKFLGYKTVGICDHNTLAGTLGFQLKAKELGLKSIIGETVSVVYNYNETDAQQTSFDLKLYVTNEQGWQNLLSINKVINVDNAENYILNKDLLKRSKGLIAVIDYTNSYFRDLRDIKEYTKKLKEYKESFEKVYFQFSSTIFTDENYDLKCLEGFKFYLDNFINEVKPLFIDDIYYLESNHSNCKQLLNKIGGFVKQHSYNQYLKTESEITKTLESVFTGDRSMDEFLIGCFVNNIQLCEACNYNIVTTERKLPKYEIDGVTLNRKEADDLFRDVCKEGFNNRIVGKVSKDKFQEYVNRYNRELKVILEAELSDYFLILWDMIAWVKENNIRMGPGRGSVGGSLLAYVIGLIDIDPIKYDLLFERFLNEARFKITFKYELELDNGKKIDIEEGKEVEEFNENPTYSPVIKVEEIKVGTKLFLEGEKRKVKKINKIQNERKDQMPDIDTDVTSVNRDDVKDYVAYKYGLDYVCSLGTYGRLRLKQSFTDLAKIKGVDFKVVKDLTKQMDNQLEYTWFDLFKFACKSKTLYDFIQENPDLINDLKIILDNPKSVSVHPSAIAILPKTNTKGEDRDLESWMPIRIVDGKIISEWEGKYTDRFGILKEDILGISQLDKFDNCLNLIKKHTGEEIDINEIDYEDKKVFDLFKKGFNEDVFQFGSYGLKNFSREVGPDTLDELIAMSALYRPGPMEQSAHKDFANIKKGKKEPSYFPAMRSVTEKTNGLFIYQEQIMKAVMVGGFSATDSENVRTAIKKFDKKEMQLWGDKFVKGLSSKTFIELILEDGSIKEFEEKTFDYSKLEVIKKRKFTIDEDVSKDIWSKLLAFSGYGFNLSHSSAYTMISYQCQWLKANYPLEFWTTALNFGKEDTDIPFYLKEIRETNSGILIDIPDINKSEINFTCDKSTKRIYWSLTKIKGIGDAGANAVLNARQQGEFTSMEDFLSRVSSKANKKIIKTLILAGAFDLMYGIDEVRKRKKILEDYYNLKDPKLLKECEHYNSPANGKNFYWTLIQKELIGNGELDFHEVVQNSNLSKTLKSCFVDFNEFLKKKTSTYKFQNRNDSKQYSICGFVCNIKEYQSKRGLFCKVELENNNSNIECIVWNDEYMLLKETIQSLKGKMIVISGKLGYDDYRKKNTLYVYEDTEIAEL